MMTTYPPESTLVTARPVECLGEFYFSVAMEVLAVSAHLSEPLALSLKTPYLAFLTQKNDSALTLEPASGPVPNQWSGKTLHMVQSDGFLFVFLFFEKF